MHIKTITSAAALVVALGFGGAAAYAQTTPLPTMIGNQQLTEADATRVQTYCNDLAGNLGEDTTATDDATEAQAGSTSDAGEQAALGSVDLDLVTIETCTEAGFLQ